jgi:hypothetical protein
VSSECLILGTIRRSKMIDENQSFEEGSEPPSYEPQPGPVFAPFDQRSWWRRTFGRSVLSMLIGHFFADKNNAASLIALILVTTLCYVVAIREKYEYVNGLLNIVFVVIGYYFGSKRQKDAEGDDAGD